MRRLLPGATGNFTFIAHAWLGTAKSSELTQGPTSRTGGWVLRKRASYVPFLGPWFPIGGPLCLQLIEECRQIRPTERRMGVTPKEADHPKSGVATLDKLISMAHRNLRQSRFQRKIAADQCGSFLSD
jgi:hypothetical protein